PLILSSIILVSAVAADNFGPDTVWVRLPDAAAYALDAPVVVDGELHIFGEPAATAPASIVWAPGSAGRFFDVTASGDLTLSRVEVSGGDAATGGAVRIAADGVGTLYGARFTGNTAGFAGGAISNAGTLAITRSTFSSNQSTFGGALHNHGDGSAVILNSLFAANSASSGGAIYQNGSMTSAVDVKNTTFSANSGFYGGAYYGKSGDGFIDFSTLRNNTAQAGGAVFMEWGTLAIGRSAWTQEGTASLCFGVFYITSTGGNVFSDGSCGATAGDDVTGAPVAMSPLVDHGGFTEVHVPLCDWSSGTCESPLINRDDLALCAEGTVERDQRDQFNRLSVDEGSVATGGGTACDVGAYEAVCQGSSVFQETVLVQLHGYQSTQGEPALLDNGDCFGHPLWDTASTSGCSIRWDVDVDWLEVADIVFLDPLCQEVCFPDTTACEQHCTGGDVTADHHRPAGWAETDNGTSYRIDVADCSVPALDPGESLRYLIGLRDPANPSAPLEYWDPKTPILNEDPPDPGCTGSC
ncbi:MAG: hypothetical protein AAGF23_23200, partial [Acidobacteriota bacterium]